MHCATCNKGQCTKGCAKCRSVYYCSRECQEEDWQQVHSKYCNDELEEIGRKNSRAYQRKFGTVMREFHMRKLHSGNKKGPLVTDERQAHAIAHSEASKE